MYSGSGRKPVVLISIPRNGYRPIDRTRTQAGDFILLRIDCFIRGGVRAKHHSRFSLRSWQHKSLCSLYPSQFLFAPFNISFGVVIHVKAGERHGNSKRLNGVDGLFEPDDGNTDNGHTFDEGSNRVCHRGGRRKDDKGDNILSEMDSAIHEEIIGH